MQTQDEQKQTQCDDENQNEVCDECQDEKQLNEDVEEVCNEMEKLKEQVSTLEDKFLRSNAEFENIKRRMEKEKSQAIAYANENFARELLPVIDALELASTTCETTDEVAGKILEGVNLTIEQFKKSFEKNGIVEIDTTKDFDPNYHNAVMQVDSDEPSGKIVQVFQKGYLINGRVLRPAMVSISK